ncbi:MAG: response regulator [Lachnospiraceae bacterium]|nr:response regulator [Lachnospiraceae bacterium]
MENKRKNTGSRTRILNAAIKEFGERGYTNAKLSDIAKRANVSYGLISAHFGSKEELLRASLRVVDENLIFPVREGATLHEILDGLITALKDIGYYKRDMFEFLYAVLVGKDIPERVMKLLSAGFKDTRFFVDGENDKKFDFKACNTFLKAVMEVMHAEFITGRTFSDNMVLLSLLNADKIQDRSEVAVKKELSNTYKELNEYTAVTNLLAKKYISIMYVNIEDGSTEFVRINRTLGDQPLKKGNFFERLEEYLKEFSAKEDRARILKFVNKKNILKGLKEKETIAESYQDLSTGTPFHNLIQITRGMDEGHIGVSFLDIDDTVRADRERQAEIAVEKREKAELIRDAELYRQAVLLHADTYWKVNVSKNKTVTQPVLGREATFERKKGIYDDKLDDYDGALSSYAYDYVDKAERRGFIEAMGKDGLTAAYEDGYTMPEITVKILFEGKVLYRRFLAYLSEFEEDGDIYAMIVVYNVTDQFKALREVEERENAIKQSVETLFQVTNPDEALRRILLTILDYYKADRTRIYEFSKDGEYASLTYEWCKKGVRRLKQESQRMPMRYFSKWLSAFEKNSDIVIKSIPNGMDKRTAMYKRFTAHGIESIMVTPFMSDGVPVGFIGVDNAKEHLEDFHVMKINAILAYSEILRRKQTDEEHVVSEHIYQNFQSVYYADFITDYVCAYKTDDRLKESIAESRRYSMFIRDYIANIIAPSNSDRCSVMLNPHYIMEQFKNTDTVEVPYLSNTGQQIAFKFIKANDEGTVAVICEIDNTAIVESERQNQERLEEARKQAEAANEAKSRFLFNMSHDIRTPMNAIMGFTELAEEKATDPEAVKGYLGKVREANEYLMSLLDDVLDMARIEAGKLKVEETISDIRTNVTEIVSILKPMAEEKDLKFGFDISGVKHYNIWEDKLRVRQILINVLTNSFKYSYDKGTVSFTIKEEPSEKEGYARYCFIIKDNGIGMSEEFLSKIYNQFERADNSAIVKAKGTGLGMAIVKRLVDILNGTIDIKSKESFGTTVTICFDFRIAQKTEKEYNKQVEESLTVDSFKDKRVLLVEDNSLNREIMENILRKFKMKVRYAENGEEAIKVLNESRRCSFDLVLMDIQMPKMNGYEATRFIRKMSDKDKAGVPIIAMTANAFEEDKREALNAGMNDHIAKPISSKELIQAMHRVLD